jgi:enamine deaminase RidA (YjgF/YER057c/UK114 family)
MASQVINPWTWNEQYGFSQAVDVPAGARVVYCAGQGSVDESGQPLHEGDMAAQIERSLDNVETVLAEAGLGLPNVVRFTYFTTDIEQFFGAMETLVSRLNRAGVRPATSLVEVQRLALPQMRVEIEATAVA